MLTTNLSTRPFYNERAVRTILGALLLLVIALTAFHTMRALSLRAREQTLSGRATEALAEAARLRGEAAAMMAQIDPKEQAAVAAAAVEANRVIDQRAFSWGALLKEIEATVPDNVRVIGVEPRVEKDVVTVTMNLEAMGPEDLAAFMNALETKGSFTRVLPHEQNVNEDDVIEAVIDGIYAPVHALEPSAAAGRNQRGTHE